MLKLKLSNCFLLTSYFYEVPDLSQCEKEKKTAYAYIPNSVTLNDVLSTDDTIDEISDELSLYSVSSHGDEIVCLDDPQSVISVTKSSSSLSTAKRRQLYNLVKPLKISQSFEAPGSVCRNDGQWKLSIPHNILCKLGHGKATSISKNLVAVVSRPIKSTKLTKLLPFSKFSEQPTTSIERPITASKDSNINESKKPVSVDKSNSEEATSSIPSSRQVTTTTNSSSSASQAGSTHKRKRNPSLSASVDDALSTIEEKLDDDDNQSLSTTGDGKMRARILSESNSRVRQITRTKEVDLGDDLASSSESQSMTTLNTETMRANTPKVVSSQSLASDILDRSESKRSSPDPRLGSRHRNRAGSGGADSAGFAQSVRIVRAQQHLLQNMIKYQNEYLAPTNTQRTRSVFIYPNRGHRSEYPFVTFKRFPGDMIQCTGGVVSVHSVKLLDHIINDEESETRDIWWTEIRKEINSHAKALNCNCIIGYRETSKVIDDICVLSAFGTAAIMRTDSEHRPSSPESHHHTLKIPGSLGGSPPPMHASMPVQCDSLDSQPSFETNDILSRSQNHSSESASVVNQVEPEIISEQDQPTAIDCSFCHTPLICAETIGSLANCSICNLSKVPDLLLLTIEPPENLNIGSKGTLVQARVCRTKRDSHGEAGAKEIGEALPFLEYELHRQLYSKLKFKGMNCLFNLDIDISIGENMISGIVTGTGCFVLGLPLPEPPRISASKGIRTSKLVEIKKLIESSALKNRELLGLPQSTEEPMTKPNIDQQQSSLEASSSSMKISSKKIIDELMNTPSTASRGDSGHHHSKHRYHHNHKHRSNSNQGTECSNNDSAKGNNGFLYDDNTLVLEVDDNEDADIVALLIDSEIPDGFTITNSELMPFVEAPSVTSINMFTQVMRAKLTGVEQFPHLFDWILQALFVKLRRSLPCCLTNIVYLVDLPEANVVQVSITGCLLGLEKLRDEEKSHKSSLDNDDNLMEVYRSSIEETTKTNKPTTSTSVSPQTTSTTSSSSASLSSSSGGEAKLAEQNQKSSIHSSPSSNSFKSIKEETGLHSSPGKEKKCSPTVDITAKNKQEDSKFILPLSSNQHQNQPVRFMRTVFKKQQTYPGAFSPAISGQDTKLAQNSSDNLAKSPTTIALPGGASRKAASIFNKVKQPLKDLSSNLNGTGSTPGQSEVTSGFILKTSRSKTNNNRVSTRSNELKSSSLVLDTVPKSLSIINHHKRMPTRSGNSSSINISSLSYVPGAKEYHYLGNLSFSFVRETGSVRENGGLNGFIHCFLMEVYAIVRAHVSALGGNALLSLRLQQSCIFYHSNKNQAQCLISIAGDAVQVSS